MCPSSDLPAESHTRQGIKGKSAITEERQPEKWNSRIKEETRQFIVSKYCSIKNKYTYPVGKITVWIALVAKANTPIDPTVLR